MAGALNRTLVTARNGACAKPRNSSWRIHLNDMWTNHRKFVWSSLLGEALFGVSSSAFFYFHHKAARLKGQPHCTPLIIKWPFPQLPVPGLFMDIGVPLRSPSRGRPVGPSSAPVTCVSSSSPAATHQRTHLPPCLPAQIWICPLENMPFQARWQYTSMIKTKWWHPNLRACMPF